MGAYDYASEMRLPIIYAFQARLTRRLPARSVHLSIIAAF